jgi:hypothetical protein
LTDEEENIDEEEQEEEQQDLRSFRDELDGLIEECMESGVGEDEIQEIMWSRIIDIDRSREEETRYLWEG